MGVVLLPAASLFSEVEAPSVGGEDNAATLDVSSVTRMERSEEPDKADDGSIPPADNQTPGEMYSCSSRRPE